MPEFTYDPIKHIYRIGSRVLPSVTDIIRYVLPSYSAGEFYMQRGTAMHLGCELLDKGTLDWATVDPRIENRLKAWQKFLAASRCVVIDSEVPLYSATYGYAGTRDRLLHGPNNQTLVADIKSTITPHVIPQLGGYSLLSPNSVEGGVAVELRADVSFRAQWLLSDQIRRAEQTFLGILSTYNFMVTHNIKGNT